MSKPIVAIVGRPNVGKSTLFNVLAGDNISIVKDTPGVTRDRIYADVEWLNHKFTLVDTGGIEPESKDIILSQMRDQAQIAIDTANVIIFITDVRQGLVDADAKVADMLRRSRKPVVLVVNKVDNFDRQMMDVYEFYNLGIGEPHAISASGKLGIGDMLDEVTGYFDPEMENEEESEIPRIAIVGKPNVGKSSLVNKLLGSNRVIVSDIAGTTRDAIDTTIMHNGNEYIFIDTAGLRKKNKIKEELERYSIIRTVSAVERADVVVLLIDATEGVTEQDAKIAGIAHERGKGMIIAVNKWDALEKDDSQNGTVTHTGLNYSLSSDCALLMNADTGQIIYGKNENVAHANASTTKIMTCILALENCKLNEKVKFSPYAASIEPSKLYANAGEIFYLKDLLYSLMLPSHNDTAVAIAEHVSGSTAKFVKLMNKKAAEIGCTNTHFATPNGLDAGYNHYTTASDLAKIAQYAIKKPMFRKLVSTGYYSFSNLNTGRSYSIGTTNALLGNVPGVQGMKTGYTNKAGYCFVGLSYSARGNTYISVVLGADSSSARWQDSRTLLTYAYNH